MSDLISRKALLEDFKNTITEQSDTIDWLNLINSQPIAYDVDKVANEITDLAGRAQTKGEYKAYWKAAKIVKGGGRDE